MIVSIVTRTSGLDEGDVTLIWRFHLNSWSLKVMMTALMQTGCPERWFDRVSIEPPVHQLQTALSYALMISEQWLDTQSDTDTTADTEFPDLESLALHRCAAWSVVEVPADFTSTGGTFFASLVSFNIQ